MMHCTTFMVRWAEDEDWSAWAMIRKPFEWNSCCWLVWDEETSREIKDNRVGLKFIFFLFELEIQVFEEKIFPIINIRLSSKQS